MREKNNYICKLDESFENRLNEMIRQLTLEEKASMTSGATGMDTVSVPRLGIPTLKMCDGPHGVRQDMATCFPTAICMAATWDPRLIQKFGVVLAEETLGKGRNTILGPCVNIHRTPQGGRNFESFSEDPHLAARMAVAYVKGVQSLNVATSTKHYAGNEQEWERMTISAEIDERTLHEIFLVPFKAAVQEGDTWTIMAAYNRFRGTYCCANDYLLNDILKKRWGFRGVVVSDWGACHGTVDSANATLDLEMPGPGQFFGSELLNAVKKGEVCEVVLDDKIRRLLRVLALMGLLDGKGHAVGKVDSPSHRRMARRIAEQGIVLLKNEKNALPLSHDRIRSIAVIGPCAAIARLGGGGSSNVTPYYSVSLLEALKKKCLHHHIKVQYSSGGIIIGDLTPISTQHLVLKGKLKQEHGLQAEYFKGIDLEGEPILRRIDPLVDFNWVEGSPAQAVPRAHFSARWTGRLIPPVSGEYTLSVKSNDGCRLYMDGKLIIDAWDDQCCVARTAQAQLEAGRSRKIRVEYCNRTGGAMIQLGWRLPCDSMEQAKQIARESDIAIVVAGVTDQFEGEGGDRINMELPCGQNELINAVASANSNTVVILNNGTPVNMISWIDNVPAVIEAWYPGQEGGHAIVSILFGDTNPSGKLPITLPKQLEDAPCHGHYPGKDGVVRYAEGIYVGYRHYDTRKIEPLFPFGHGLSYTQFLYSDLSISSRRKKSAGLTVKVNVRVENTGSRDGAEIVQLYVHDHQCHVDRPQKELKAFAKIHLHPAQSKVVALELHEKDFAYYHTGKQDWVAEPGEFELLVGSSSRDIRLNSSFTLD